MKVMIDRFATCGIAVSTPAADSLFPKTWKSDDRWDIFQLGIDLSAFTKVINPEQLRRELGIPNEAVVIGHVGRFAEQKNHRFLVEIAAEFVKIEPKAFFVLIGGGPLRESIEQQVRACHVADRFLFLGVRGDVPVLLKGCMDAFLFPSHYEGCPVALMEAQAAGLPCLISDSIPKAACVIDELLEYKKLSDTAENWARTLHERVLGKKISSSCLSRLHSIERSTASLEKLYASAYDGSKPTRSLHADNPTQRAVSG
jgi:glycosyltransferase involved in cell wall biosynthesis